MAVGCYKTKNSIFDHHSKKTATATAANRKRHSSTQAFAPCAFTHDAVTVGCGF
jgi:hypothetical protein